MPTQKAGTVLINKETRQVALVYRKKHGDLSFPKGHLEEGETLIECAIRETVEETGRDCHLVNDTILGTISYTTNKNEEVINYMYLAIDDGKHDGESVDPEICTWVYLDEVADALCYDNLVTFWKVIFPRVKEEMDK